MRKKTLLSILNTLIFIGVFSLGSIASESSSHSTENGDTKSEIKQDIKHHLQDAYDFHLFTDKTTNTHYGFPLPVILFDDGLKVFLSSKFHHGESVAEVDGNFYMLHHNHIYKTDADGTVNYDEQGHITNQKPLDFSITKNVFSALLAAILMFWLFSSMAKSYQRGPLPTGFGRFVEPVVIFIRDEVARPNIGEKHYKKFMGYLLTIFFFIWIVNLFGLTPLGINVTGNIAVTFSLAFLTFLITQFTAKAYYWKHIFWMPGVPTFMKIVLAPIELLGVFIKPFALMIRLYANITAGHVVLMSLIGLLFIFHNWFARGAFFGLTIFLSLIELLVAFLQAYIFTLLSALYFGFAVEEHDDHH